jgi:hypothetical protein
MFWKEGESYRTSQKATEGSRTFWKEEESCMPTSILFYKFSRSRMFWKEGESSRRF